MGALFPKTIRNYRWPGNPPPRVHEVPAGLHSSVGIPCNDWSTFVENDVPILRSLNVPSFKASSDAPRMTTSDCARSDLGVFG
jgi:dihydroorotate dehydrogenase (NAD+) catalytic subunit